jgi:DNA-binding MarR family transcriptional regulator
MKLEEELKMKQFESPHHRTLLNIMFTSSWLGDRMSGITKPYDISEQQYNVLRILRGQKGKPVNLMDIQERMLHKTSNATRLVEKLRQKGLVERVLCEQNRRKVEISITRKGLDLLAELDPILNTKDTEMFTTLTNKEAILLGDLLDKLRG